MSLPPPFTVKTLPAAEALPASPGLPTSWLAQGEGREPPVTVSTKVSEAASAPSETLTVMVAVPVRPAAGVTVTVRFAPLPPKAMPLRGTRVVLLELPVRASAPAAVSTSPTVNARGPRTPLMATVWLGMSLMVGGVFGSGTSLTERETVAWAAVWPSDTWNTKLSAPKKFGLGV